MSSLSIGLTLFGAMLVLMALHPRARNPAGVGVAELFRTPPDQVRDWIRGPYRSAWGRVFKVVDRLVRAAEPRFPARVRQRAIRDAVAFVRARLNGEDGLGAIYPAMANAVMMFDALGLPPEHPDADTAWRAVRKLLVLREDRAYLEGLPDAPLPLARRTSAQKRIHADNVERLAP